MIRVYKERATGIWIVAQANGWSGFVTWRAAMNYADWVARA